jgi:hypothetical protein
VTASRTRPEQIDDHHTVLVQHCSSRMSTTPRRVTYAARNICRVSAWLFCRCTALLRCSGAVATSVCCDISLLRHQFAATSVCCDISLLRHQFAATSVCCDISLLRHQCVKGGGEYLPHLSEGKVDISYIWVQLPIADEAERPGALDASASSGASYRNAHMWCTAKKCMHDSIDRNKASATT